jgi:hypothetical protein
MTTTAARSANVGASSRLGATVASGAEVHHRVRPAQPATTAFAHSLYHLVAQDGMATLPRVAIRSIEALGVAERDAVLT